MLDITDGAWRAKRYWTALEVEELKACWLTATPEQLALRFGRTAYAVQCKAHALRLLVRPRFDEWPQERTDKLIHLWKAGLSSSQIALTLGITRNAVIGKVQRLGLSEQYPHPNNGGRAPRMDSADRARIRSDYRRIKPVQPVFESAFQPPKHLVLDSYPVSILELSDDTCRWPYGDPKEMGFHYCGGVTGGKTYCPHHQFIAFDYRRAA